jgi:hypothetical protein
VPVIEREWSKSVEDNPAPEYLYPYQVSSWEELRKRVIEYNNTTQLFIRTLIESQERTNKLRRDHSIVIGKMLGERKAVNRLIFEKIIQVNSILESAAIRYNRMQKNIPDEMCLENKLKKIRTEIEAPSIKSRLNDIRVRAEDLGRREENVLRTELSEGNARTVLYILEQERRGIEAMIKIHKENLHDIWIIEKGLKELGIPSKDSRIIGMT